MTREITGVIIGYRRGPRSQYNNCVLVRLDLPGGEVVDKYIGRKVIVRDKYGNEYIGRIIRRHSRNHPIVRVRFKPNIPGQLIGSKVIVQ